MQIVLLAEPVSMNARLKQFLKATFIKLIPKFAPIAALVQMFALLKQFTRHSFSVHH